MPIVILEEQRRFRELGRIRLGDREVVLVKSGPNAGKPAMKDGKVVTRPRRLADFRLTSPWRHLLDAAKDAGIGGEVKPWSPSEGRNEFELITDRDVLEVLVPPGEVLSQWMEEWSGGGCARRCDGRRMIVAQGKSADRACLCNPNGETPMGELKCKPTTRLLLMVPGLPDLGVWRVESHGINAALELGKAVELTELATRRGVIIPAELRIEHREIRKPGEPLKRFSVPVLGFRFGLGETLAALGFGDPGSLAMIAGTGPLEARPALNAGGTPELTLGDPTDAREPGARTGPVEESSLPSATGGVATERQEPGSPPPPAEPPSTATDKDTVDDAVVIPPEPDAFVPPAHDPDAEHGGEGGSTLTQAQFIAIKAREAGVDDETRHAVIGIVTRGRTRTGKEVTVGDEVTRITRLFASIKGGTITVERTGDPPVWTFTDSKGAVMRLNVDNTVTRVDLGEHGDERGNFKPPAAKK